MAQSVKHPTLDFSSGQDLGVCEFEPCTGLYADSAGPAWDSFSPSLSVPAPLVLSLSFSLKINKYIKKIFLIKKNKTILPTFLH